MVAAEDSTACHAAMPRGMPLIGSLVMAYVQGEPQELIIIRQAEHNFVGQNCGGQVVVDLTAAHILEWSRARETHTIVKGSVQPFFFQGQVLSAHVIEHRDGLITANSPNGDIVTDFTAHHCLGPPIDMQQCQPPENDHGGSEQKEHDILNLGLY